MSTASLYRVKAAQKQLIALLGGLDDAGLLDQFGRSTLGRWANLDDPTLMPLNAVMTLERMVVADGGEPLVTRALAEIAGRRLADPGAAAAGQQNVMSRHAEAIVQAGELMAAGAAAFADGRVTPNEATGIDRAAGALEQALGEYRKALAGIRAEGGLSVVGGRAGGRS